MNNRGNINLGDEIVNIVQNALNNKDFNRLNRDVQNIAKDALDEARMAIGLSSRNPTKGKNDSNTIRQPQPTNQTANKNVINSYNKVQQPKNKAAALNQTKYTVPMGQVSGVLLSVFGTIGTVALGIAIFVLTLLGNLMGSLFYTIAVFLLPLFILSIGLVIKGTSNRKRLKRFQKYVLCVGGRSYCSINDLSAATGLSNKYIEKDLRKMIKSGMFPEGHIDNKKTTFMLTNESYKQYQEVQYLEVRDRIANKNVKQIEKKIETTDYNGLNSEMKKSLEEGRQFVLRIREANIAIPGEEISRKLDRLEEVTGKIFSYVENHPEKFSEIRKFTDYFLPTTLKLVDAYKRLDNQTVRGQNISSAKREIENTMDTINSAFENLLDDLFQDMAMDISTDISVLETMFAQEGLTKDNMRIKNKPMEDK